MITKKIELDIPSVIMRLENIVTVAIDYEIDADSQIDGYDYLKWDIEKLINELKRPVVRERPKCMKCKTAPADVVEYNYDYKCAKCWNEVNIYKGLKKGNQ